MTWINHGEEVSRFLDRFGSLIVDGSALVKLPIQQCGRRLLANQEDDGGHTYADAVSGKIAYCPGPHTRFERNH